MKKRVIIVVGIAAIVLAAIFTLKFFSSEDTWICEDGIWIKHGNPIVPMPEEQCNTVK